MKYFLENVERIGQMVCMFFFYFYFSKFFEICEQWLMSSFSTSVCVLLSLCLNRVAVLTEKEPERPRMASAVARAYIGGLGAEPPAGSRGKAPGQGVRGRSPPEAESFLVDVRPTERPKLRFLTVFCSAY